MINSWVRRTSLKKPAAKTAQMRFLSGIRATNPVMLMGMMALFIAVGVFVVQKSLAAVHKTATPTPVPTIDLRK